MTDHAESTILDADRVHIYARLPEQHDHPNLQIAPGVNRLATRSTEAAFIPIPAWRSVTREDLQSLLIGHGPRVSDLVLLTLPDDLLYPLRACLSRTPSGAVDVQEVSRKLPGVAEAISSWLNRAGLPFSFRLLGSNLAINGPEQSSTAYDPVHQEYRGLHIDDHEKLSLPSRNEAFVLLNINVGLCERYLQFVPWTVAGLRKLLEQGATDSIADRAVKDIKTLYLTRYPCNPIYRLVLQPGQAYLCQTQNVIHDGATNCSGQPDISYLLAFRALPLT